MESDINRIRKHIVELSKYSSTKNGVTRLSFTEEHRKAKEYIIEEMQKHELEVREDPVGNIIGRRSGTKDNLPAIMVGSHLDSVKNGGRFDGTVGIVAALEIAGIMKQNNINNTHPIEFVAFVGEEEARFGSRLLGSRAMAGLLSENELKNEKDENNISCWEAIKEFGLNPELIPGYKVNKEAIKAFLELHIEQGPVLEKMKAEIGLVEDIVGMTAYEVTIEGKADHAGTTPMDVRMDSLVEAADIIKFVNERVKGVGSNTVGTVGKLSILPNVTNVVPGKAKFNIEVRSPKEEKIHEVINSIKERLKEIQAKGFNTSCNELEFIKPVKLDKVIVDVFRKQCEELSLKAIPMLSGAGHDAMIMASLAPTAMVFVPSKNGRSHSPEEWSEYEDIKKGIDLLLSAILNIDED